MKDRIARIKQFIKENEGPLIFGVGVGVGAIVVSSYPKFFLDTSRYPFGTAYNPDQPIPGLRLSEDEIKRDLVTGIMVAGFLKEKGLLEDLFLFSAGWREELLAAYKSGDSYEDFPLLSRVKL